jgi:hypothetical protein
MARSAIKPLDVVGNFAQTKADGRFRLPIPVDRLLRDTGVAAGLVQVRDGTGCLGERASLEEGA